MNSVKKRVIRVVFSVWLLAFCVTGCAGAAAEHPADEPMQDSAVAWDVENDAVEVTEPTLPGEAAGNVEGVLTVTFLDVGQGNAVLVENDGLYMLIDGGDREYSSFVVSYLKQHGVEELAYIVASHYDADHINGVVGALNVFDCEVVLAPDYVTDTRVYQSFCDVVSEKDIALVSPAVGETYTLGDAVFTIVCPDRYGYAEANDNSIGLRLVHGENSFLICGDAGTDMEKKMMESGVELDCDVYMASHHGSNGSTSPEFLEAVSPAAVVISVGTGNSYGHPAERVLADIADIGAMVYRTDQLGTITATSDGQEIVFSAEREYYGDAGDFGEKSDDTAAGSEEEEASYVLNRNTMKFHLPSCGSVADIHAENRIDFTGTREEVIEAGYEPCKRCDP